MKKTIILIAIAFSLNSALLAQPSSENTTAATTGKVVLPDNSIREGSVQDNIRKKGEIVIIADGKKTRYRAGEINRASVGGTSYITWNYTFYELVHQGKNLELYRKANEPAAVQYNGSEAVAISSEGKVDDLFLRKTGSQSLQLITAKNFRDLLSASCGACATGIQAGDKDAIRKAVETCDTCR